MVSKFDLNFLYLTNKDGYVFRVEEFEMSRSIDRMDEYVFKCTAMPTRNFDAIKAASFNIKKVIFNDPATIVTWADGTKTVVKCQDGDIYNKRTGLLLCMAKKMYGNKNKFNDILNKWCPEEEEEEECPSFLGKWLNVPTEPTTYTFKIKTESGLEYMLGTGSIEKESESNA